MPSLKQPLPKPDEDSEPYWQACRRHELQMQRCRRCATVRFRPRVVCPECLSDEADWVRLSGDGTVHTFAIVRSPVLPAFAESLPYTLALVDLKEGPRLTTRIVDCAPEEVAIGMPVEVTFVDLSEAISLPYFRPLRS